MNFMDLTEIARNLLQSDGIVVHGVVRDLMDGELALIAVEDSNVEGMSMETRHKLREELDVNEVMLVKWDKNIKQFLRNAFTPVCVLDVVFEFDPVQKNEFAKVVVAEDDLGAAIGENAVRARLAAMLTGKDLEVVTECESWRK